MVGKSKNGGMKCMLLTQIPKRFSGKWKGTTPVMNHSRGRGVFGAEFSQPKLVSLKLLHDSETFHILKFPHLSLVLIEDSFAN